jgi:TolB-like protein/Flp pilus assembly protein TadD/tRNA A-37 threonylcarbamoyl transferase component Bud32
MGEVYKARDTRLGRNVAVKVLAEALSENPHFRDRLQREAKTISRLQHPHICTLYDIGFQDEMQYLVMEYLEGETLEQRLRAGPLPLDEALKIGGEIADAIDAAHRSGVVHRDLKPGNVMLGRAGSKVLDFGLARGFEAERPESVDAALTTHEQALTQSDAIVGTLPYMAPEQLEGKSVDARTDIWALGCVLYEMVAGSRPFRGPSKAALISSIMNGTPESMTGKQPLASERLEWVVSRCLEKDPEKRWQSSRDIALELETVDGSSTGAPMSGWRAPGAAPIKARVGGTQVGRRRQLLLGLAAVMVIAAVLGTWVWNHRTESDTGVVSSGAAVAVLPFENVSGNDQIDYIGLGLAAGLISQLAELPGINVVGRSQTWSLREKVRSTAELAESLGVNLLVEGEVHGAGEELRVDLSMLESGSGTVLWSRSFDGSQEGLYDLQQQIATAMATVLSVPLSAADRRRLARGGPASRAFDYYLQGLERLEDSDNPRHLEFAADLFRQAIRIDGEVAAFHAALSTALWRRSLETPAGVDWNEIEQEARQALALDTDLPEAHVALARALRGRGRYAESIAQLRPLLAKHPKPDEAFRELAHGYYYAGDTEASAECLATAVSLAPDNWFNWNALGVFQTSQSDLDAAKSSLEKALELAPESVTQPRLNLGGVKLLEGDYAGAIEDFEATGATTSNPKLASNMATAYFFQDRLDRAVNLYELAVSLDPMNHQYRRNLGDALSSLNREEEAAVEYRAGLRLVEQELDENPSSNLQLRSRALYAAKVGDCGAAIKYAVEARPLLPSNWQNQLDLAMTFALCGRREEALQAARLCVEGGLPGAVLRQQPELMGLANDPEFLKLTETSAHATS